MSRLRYKLALYLCGCKSWQWLGVWLMTKEEAAELEREIVRHIIKIEKDKGP